MVASQYNSTIASAEKVRDHRRRRRSAEHYAHFLDSLKEEFLYDLGIDMTSIQTSIEAGRKYGEAVRLVMYYVTRHRGMAWRGASTGESKLLE